MTWRWSEKSWPRAILVLACLSIFTVNLICALPRFHIGIGHLLGEETVRVLELPASSSLTYTVPVQSFSEGHPETGQRVRVLIGNNYREDEIQFAPRVTLVLLLFFGWLYAVTTLWLRRKDASDKVTGRKGFMAVVLVPIVLAVAAIFWPRALPEATIRQALASTTLARFTFEDAPLADGLNVIIPAFREQHPELRKVRVISHFSAADASANIGRFTCDLRDVPADYALSVSTGTTGNGWAIREGNIHLYPLTITDGGLPPLTTSEKLSAHIESLYWKFKMFSSR
jgi:hypothetical protein